MKNLKYLKKISLYIILILPFISCNTSKEGLQGKWSYYQNDDIDGTSIFTFVSLEFIDDSLVLIDEFQREYRLNIKINNNSIICFGDTYKLSLKNDSVLKFNDCIYVNETHSAYQNNKYLTLEVPNIICYDKLEFPKKSYLTYIKYGKRVDDGTHSLLLNESYSKIKDLSEYLENSSNCVAVFDKNIKMKFIQNIFDEIRQANLNKIYFVTNTTSFKYDQGCIYKIRPYFESEYKIRYKNSDDILPPPPPPPPPNFVSVYFDSIDNCANQQIIFLDSKNNVFLDSVKIHKSELETNLIHNLNPNILILFLFDDNSSFEEWLNIYSCIYRSYKDLKEKMSLEIYKTTSKNLSDSQKVHLSTLYPFKVIDININEYKSINNH